MNKSKMIMSFCNCRKEVNECIVLFTEMPSVMDIVARKKWEAWKSKSGISKEEAQKSYINYVQTLVSKYS